MRLSKVSVYFLNSPFSNTLALFPHVLAQCMKCSNFLEQVYIFQKEHIHSQNLIITQNCFGAEIKAESSLSLQYNTASVRY